MSVKTIGFIGLGMMGEPMSACLAAAGFRLYVADADAARVAAVCEGLGASPLTPEVAGELDMLVTMLPNSDIVEKVLLGDGWAERLRAGALVVDMSSSEPVRSRELAGSLAARQLDYLDAPVSGGVKRAREGSLAILVGGSEAVLGRARPVLEAMGTSILFIGPAGSGHAAKALNNFVSACGLMVTVEALHVARRFGISPDVMTDVLNASSGRSNTSENKVKQFMLSGTFGSGFSLRLMDKDLTIAKSLAGSVGYTLTFGEHGVETWHRAAEKASASTDHTEMYRFLSEDG
ncbi:MAG: NAD(P)-dependent oxidoreductase [Alphaproteobacteria bacterium]|nr:NAD(P)-dependent oxidoreductase [Rhizobiaceae bacterium]MBU3963346.1 NAD(P)-dependent oxidoreductase [Alphaproteobacteria bacterium]MBU4052446.1 NAD(P)-dependent oxidoreductase [Alphaproteobacteria bacterium]MBU4090206.1 NAD(P)-dependent oxidoreductase [Alphaproteobacteria bacterium]MBU4156471.1 NAD(P)-dependent oxidoreductase [Alphaproteobacteria bacterium]